MILKHKKLDNLIRQKVSDEYKEDDATKQSCVSLYG